MPDHDHEPPDVELFPFLARLDTPPAWEDAARRFLELGGPVMVVGAPDSGKSTLSRYLIYKIFAAGLPAALVDLDLGQSHLGPPGVLGLDLYPPRVPGDDSLHPESLYFIGQTSPVGCTLEVAVGCRALADQAARRGVDRVVVNTSGLVHGPGALRLKKAQVELLQPRLILGLQCGQELEPLLNGLGGNRVNGATPGGWAVLRLPVSSLATSKMPDDRRRFREVRFRRYFQDARRLTLPWSALAWEGLPWGRGEILPAGELTKFTEIMGVTALYGEVTGDSNNLLLAEPPPGQTPSTPAGHIHWLTWSGLHYRLVGFLDAARRTLGLGVILPSPFRPGEMEFWTPMNGDAAREVHFLKIGKMRISLSGKEMAYV